MKTRIGKLLESIFSGNEFEKESGSAAHAHFNNKEPESVKKVPELNQNHHFVSYPGVSDNSYKSRSNRAAHSVLQKFGSHHGTFNNEHTAEKTDNPNWKNDKWSEKNSHYKLNGHHYLVNHSDEKNPTISGTEKGMHHLFHEE